MKSYAVSVAFRATDRVSPVMKGITQKVSSTMGHTTRSFERATGAAQNLGGVLRTALSLYALKRVISFTEESIKLFQIQENAVAAVDSKLASTGSLVGRTTEAIQEMASSLQKQSTFGDEAILQNVSSQILSFTNIRDEIFEGAHQAVLDVTASLHGADATGQDLQSTALQLSKALNAPTQNLSALSRTGIQFSKDQRDLIGSLWEAGHQADAQRLILAELETQYGGTAAALAKTSQGQEIAIKNTLGDVRETYGELMQPFKLWLLESLQRVLPSLQRLFTTIADNMHIIRPLALGVASAFLLIKGIMLGIQAIGFAKMILQFTSSLKLHAIATRAASIATGLFNAIMNANPIALIVLAIAGLVAGIIALASHVGGFGNLWKLTWGAIQTTFFTVLSAMYTPLLALIEVLMKVVAWGGKALGFDTSGIEAVAEKVKESRQFVNDRAMWGDKNAFSAARQEIALQPAPSQDPSLASRMPEEMIQSQGTLTAERIEQERQLIKDLAGLGDRRALAGGPSPQPAPSQALSLAAQERQLIRDLAGLGDRRALTEARRGDSLQLAPSQDPSLAARMPERQIQFQGKLDIAGAPEGSRISSSTQGAPPVALSLLSAGGGYR